MASKKEIEDGKIVAFLAYLLIGIIWYFVDENMKKNTYVKFHVKQGLVLLIFSVILAIVGIILASIVGVIVGFLAAATYGMGMILMFIPGLIMFLVWAINIILLIFGIINSLSGKEKELPVIGRFGKKFTF
ncbi:MAG: hypothetical protein ABIG93_01670 [archaeon]